MGEIVLGRTSVVQNAALGNAGPATSATAPGDPQIEVVTISLDMARTEAKFPIRQPAYLPWSGMSLGRVDVGIVRDGGERRAFMVSLKYEDGSGHWMVLRHHAILGDTKHATPSGAQSGQVGDHPAAFSTFSIPARTLPGGRRTVARCIWEQDGLLMELQGADLSTSDLARIGASVA